MTSSSATGGILGLSLLLVALAGSAGCESNSSPSPTAPSGSLQVTLGAGVLKAGDTTVATVSAGGVPATAVTWTSSDATVAVVGAGNVVSGRRAGRATLTALSGSASGQASVRVVSNFGGSWAGPLLRNLPSCAATSTAPVCSSTTPPATLLSPIRLELVQTGATVTGTLVDTLEPASTILLTGTIADDDVLVLSGATASSPTPTRQLTVTNLRASFDPTVGTITGSYTMVAATVATSGTPVTDYSFQAQFRDLRRP